MNEFPTSRPPLAKFRVNLLRLAWLTVLFALLSVFFVASGAGDFDGGLYFIVPFTAVFLGISIYRAILIFLNLKLEVLVYEDGFTYSNKGETKKYRWKDIDKIWTTRFELHSLIYINYIRVKILDTSGNILILDRTLQKVDKFEALLQEQVARDKFPTAVAMLEQGKSLEFGGLTLTNDYIKSAHDAILWSELGDLQTWQGSIRLWKKGQRAISMMASIPSTPNFALLIVLIGHLSQTAQTAPPQLQNERDIKARQQLERLKVNEPAPSKVAKLLRGGGNADARLSGLFLFLLGAGAGYWQIVMPIMAALRHEASVSYSAGLVVAAVLGISIGLFLLIFGAEGLGAFSKPSQLFIIVISFVLFAFGFGCYFGMGFIMKLLGYS